MIAVLIAATLNCTRNKTSTSMFFILLCLKYGFPALSLHHEGSPLMNGSMFSPSEWIFVAPFQFSHHIRFHRLLLSAPFPYFQFSLVFLLLELSWMGLPSLELSASRNVVQNKLLFFINNPVSVIEMKQKSRLTYCRQNSFSQYFPP